jgi:capsular exopolysaccharide synthesis family protein
LLEQIFELQSLRADLLISLPTRVVEPAALPTSPLSRGTTTFVLQAFAVALVLGVGITWLLEYLNTTVKTSRALDDLYDIPSQGTIGGAEKRGDPQPLLAPGNSLAPYPEDFRALRIAMNIAGLGTTMRSLLVTSATPGEGKTFVATHLAISMAQSGANVVLVDTNPLDPALHDRFGVRQEPGVVHLLRDPQIDLDFVLQPTAIENLRVLTSSALSKDLAGLLSSPRAAAALERLEQSADAVIYDASPMMSVTDVAFIASRAGAVVQVVRAGHARADQVLRCKAILDRIGAHILGPILNHVSRPTTGRFYTRLVSGWRSALRVVSRRSLSAYRKPESIVVPKSMVDSD